MRNKTYSFSEKINIYEVINEIQVGTKVYITDYEDDKHCYIMVQEDDKYILRSDDSIYCVEVDDLNDLLSILKEDYDEGLIKDIQIYNSDGGQVD